MLPETTKQVRKFARSVAEDAAGEEEAGGGSK